MLRGHEQVYGANVLANLCSNAREQFEQTYAAMGANIRTNVSEYTDQCEQIHGAMRENVRRKTLRQTRVWGQYVIAVFGRTGNETSNDKMQSAQVVCCCSDTSWAYSVQLPASCQQGYMG